ncbi:MAG TPA: putative molybdenum carrier protein [Kofleriaceae bacterium]|nr:putative molybdenum carrier protein [Kofleriaceae bacterium]
MKIVSGGQTGADRGALDAAIELGLAHGGWCPRGHLAEDGVIPPLYQLREHPRPGYPARTDANARDSDGTLLVTRGAPTGGSALTVDRARAHARPLLHLDLDQRSIAEAARELRQWLAAHRIAVLNVAGPRASTCPGIAADVRALLVAALSADPAE